MDDAAAAKKLADQKNGAQGRVQDASSRRTAGAAAAASGDATAAEAADGEAEARAETAVASLHDEHERRRFKALDVLVSSYGRGHTATSMKGHAREFACMRS